MAKKSTCTITIKDELSINNIEEIHSSFSSKIMENSNIIINLNNIEQIDITGLQYIQSIKNLKDKKVTIKANIDQDNTGLLEHTGLLKILNL